MRRRDAGEGKPLTLVMTDVEGSTELWEWDRASMMDAVNIHDTVMRSLLPRFCGYEVSTEGERQKRVCVYSYF